MDDVLSSSSSSTTVEDVVGSAMLESYELDLVAKLEMVELEMVAELEIDVLEAIVTVLDGLDVSVVPLVVPAMVDGDWEDCFELVDEEDALADDVGLVPLSFPFP